MQIVETDPANSAQWGYHLWLLRCAACHVQNASQGDHMTRVLGILESSKCQCQQIAAAESDRMATLRRRSAPTSVGSAAG